MSEMVIARATELGTSGIVVVGIAHHSDPVNEASSGTIVGDGMPVLTGQNDSRMGRSLDQLTTIWKCLEYIYMSLYSIYTRI